MSSSDTMCAVLFVSIFALLLLTGTTVDHAIGYPLPRPIRQPHEITQAQVATTSTEMSPVMVKLTIVGSILLGALVYLMMVSVTAHMCYLAGYPILKHGDDPTEAMAYSICWPVTLPIHGAWVLGKFPAFVLSKRKHIRRCFHAVEYAKMPCPHCNQPVEYRRIGGA